MKYAVLIVGVKTCVQKQYFKSGVIKIRNGNRDEMSSSIIRNSYDESIAIE
jgi:hypothetical protein